MQQMQKIQPVLRQAGVSGEIERMDYSPAKSTMVFTVMKPGQRTTLELDLKSRTVEMRRADSQIAGPALTRHSRQLGLYEIPARLRKTRRFNRAAIKESGFGAEPV